MPISKSHVLMGGLAGAAVAVAAMAGAASHGTPFGDGYGRLIKASTAPVVASAPGMPMSFADIFEKVSPAVVSIHVTSKIDPSQVHRGIEGFPFDLIPRGGSPEPQEGEGRPTPKQLSSGSGFFISPDGFICTNNHVVENADEIKVILKDGRELKATVVGRDEGTDLAVIRVEGKDFPYVNFEDRARPRVGDWVLAVGNPYDLGGTATAGIVSAYNRDIGEKFVDYIQIDAPINRGNSGGPTFDTYGRVIGVNTAIFSPSGGSVGIGFDIPADIAQNVTKQLMAGRKITRGYLGAQVQNLTDEMASAWGLKEHKGAVIAEVVAGGPAAKAGMKSGDIVVSVNGRAVGSASELTREVTKVRTGDTMHLSIYRDGQPKTIDVVAGLRPSEAQLAKGGPAEQGDDAGDGAGPAASGHALGMAFVPLDAGARQELNLPPNQAGVVVESVKNGSDAADKGLRRGDVIVKAGDRAVASPADVNAAIAVWKKAGRASIPLGVIRGGISRFVAVKIEG